MSQLQGDGSRGPTRQTALPHDLARFRIRNGGAIRRCTGAVSLHAQDSIVHCAGAFNMAPANCPLTPTDLVDVGLTRELVDRMGSVWMLPTPGHARRASIAREALRDVEAFALRFGVTVTGTEEFVATQPAPEISRDYIGLRGFLHFVTQRVLAAVAEALTQQRTHIDLMDSRGDA